MTTDLTGVLIPCCGRSSRILSNSTGEAPETSQLSGCCLSLGSFLKKQKGTPSHLDDSFYFWKDSNTSHGLSGALTTHVDDLAVTGDVNFKDPLYKAMTKEFGKLSRQNLPFTHCGALYSATATGLKMDQSDFAKRLKPAPVPTGNDDRDLQPAELTAFRSVLGGLLWLCSTRLDIIAEVGILQSAVRQAKVKRIKMANALVKKATENGNHTLGLHYRYVKSKRWRTQCIHDASSASQGRHYAQEGVIVLLIPELPQDILNQDVVCENSDAARLCNYGHVLYAQGSKAKRVSYSTSHAEILAAVAGLEASSMVSTRLTELWLPEPAPTLAKLTYLQENGSGMFPIDTATDCRDFFELVTGSKSLPQDKFQRLYVLSFKEARVSGRLWFYLMPTQCMTADALTKPMKSDVMSLLLSTGYSSFWNEPQHPVLLRRLPVLANIEEEDLFKDDQQIVREVSAGRKVMTALTMAAALTGKYSYLALLTLPSVNALSVNGDETSKEDSMYLIGIILIIYGILRIMENAIGKILKYANGASTARTNPRSSSSESTVSSGEAHVAEPAGPIRRNRALNLSEPDMKTHSSVYLAPTGECYHLNPRCVKLHQKVIAKRLCSVCAKAQSSGGVL